MGSEVRLVASNGQRALKGKEFVIGRASVHGINWHRRRISDGRGGRKGGVRRERDKCKICTCVLLGTRNDLGVLG